MLHCGSEKEGLDTFYKLLEEFRNRDKSLDKKEKVSVSYTYTNKHQEEAKVNS